MEKKNKSLFILGVILILVKIFLFGGLPWFIVTMPWWITFVIKNSYGLITGLIDYFKSLFTELGNKK